MGYRIDLCASYLIAFPETGADHRKDLSDFRGSGVAGIERFFLCVR
jgi:hypothetical protein